MVDEGRRIGCGLFKNGVFLEETTMSPQQFLISYPKGGYTTILARNGRVVDWASHSIRLNRTVELLAQDSPQLFKNFLQWAKNKNGSLSELMSDWTSSNAERAWEACRNHLTESDLWMTVILAIDGPQSNGGDGGAAANPPLDIIVYVKNATEFLQPPCDVYVMGGPRTLPEAKDSQWVADRQMFESIKPEGCQEVILSTPSGGLLEGLKSNFFVVTGVGKDAKLITASISDGVLGGITRKRVLQAAVSLGFTVIEAPPNSDNMETWNEAFVTNSLIGIQPVKRIACPKGLASMTDLAWERILPSPEGPVTKAIAGEVLSLQTMASVGNDPS